MAYNPISPTSAAAAIGSVQGTGALAMERIRSGLRAESQLEALLDAFAVGATSVAVPGVASVAEAERIVGAVAVAKRKARGSRLAARHRRAAAGFPAARHSARH